MLTAAQLHGWSYDKAMLMGLPHIGALYTGKRNYKAKTGRCEICGDTAGSVHHIVPVRAGREFYFVTDCGTFNLRSPLITLCGTGSTGCHGKFHDGTLKAEWRWIDHDARLKWESGEYLAEYGEHSNALYKFGWWQIKKDGAVIAEIWS